VTQQHECPNCGPASPGPSTSETVRGGRRLGTGPANPITARLAEIALLEPGWLDGQGEEITGRTLHTAKAIAAALPANLHPLLISPTEPGGIDIEWRDQHGTHSIEIQPDGTLFLLSDDGTDPGTVEVEAHPPFDRWRVEILDATDWMPAGALHADKDKAQCLLDAASTGRPAWADGTPVERRLVRETTTYTVEPRRRREADTGRPVAPAVEVSGPPAAGEVW
jgi:hypothetical protein